MGSLSLSVILQTEARDVSLRILERTGLVLKQQRSVLVLTVHDQEEEVKVEDIHGMSPTHIAKLYTVSSMDLSAQIVHALAVFRRSHAIVQSICCDCNSLPETFIVSKDSASL